MLIKAVKSKYLRSLVKINVDLITFSVTDSVLSASVNIFPEASVSLCE